MYTFSDTCRRKSTRPADPALHHVSAEWAGRSSRSRLPSNLVEEDSMPWRVFYSYSHRDAELRARLATYLAPLRHQGKIVEWHDRKIEPGTNWNAELAERLDSADLFILLISEHFLDSDYC